MQFWDVFEASVKSLFWECLDVERSVSVLNILCPAAKNIIIKWFIAHYNYKQIMYMEILNEQTENN